MACGRRFGTVNYRNLFQNKILIANQNKYKSDRANSNKSNKRRLNVQTASSFKTNLKKDNHDESNDD